MKLTIEGMPEEIAEFLAAHTLSKSASVSRPYQMIDRLADEVRERGYRPINVPDDATPPPQVIEPVPIERSQFGAIGSDADAALIHRQLAELVKLSIVQSDAASMLSPSDPFEPPMLLARRFVLGQCVRAGVFDLAAFDALRQRYQAAGTPSATFEDISP